MWSIASVLALAACEPAVTRPPLPSDASGALDVVLTHAHGPTRGGMEHVLVELRSDATGPATETIALSGRRIRIDYQDGSTDIGGPDGAWRCRAGAQPLRLTDPDADRVARWPDLLRAMLLTPLEKPKAASWRGPEVIAIEAADGTTWRLELDLPTQRPRSVTGPGGEVLFTAFLTTPVSNLPAQVRLGDVGERRVRFVATDVLFDDYVFQDPTARPAAGLRRGLDMTRVVNREARPLQPQVEVLDATLVLALADPGDWAGRATAIQAAGEVLEQQGQVGQGLPFTFDDGGTPRLGVPFEPDDASGHRPFTARKDQDVRRRPRHFAAVIYRGKGDLGDAMREAPAALAAFVAARGLTSDGPLRVIPYLAWEDGPPAADRLANVAVRFEQPVQDDPAARALTAGGK